MEYSLSEAKSKLDQMGLQLHVDGTKGLIWDPYYSVPVESIDYDSARGTVTLPSDEEIEHAKKVAPLFLRDEELNGTDRLIPF